MHNPWHDIPSGPHPPEELTAIIEIPAGSRNKYELDKETGHLRLDRVLYSAVHYPGDYGFVPRTLHEDGDPLDVIVRLNEPTFPGCQIAVRPVGVLKMLDKGEPDDKVLAVPSHDPYFAEFFDIADLSAHYLKEVEHFFAIYKDLEGKRVEVLGWEKSEVAMQITRDSITRYAAKYGADGSKRPRTRRAGDSAS
jgi:inorganic pyrophosphatase